jgi:hypothetical protein
LFKLIINYMKNGNPPKNGMPNPNPNGIPKPKGPRNGAPNPNPNGLPKINVNHWGYMRFVPEVNNDQASYTNGNSLHSSLYLLLCTLKDMHHNWDILGLWPFFQEIPQDKRT